MKTRVFPFCKSYISLPVCMGCFPVIRALRDGVQMAVT